MRASYYPETKHLLRRHRSINGHQSGIAESFLLTNCHPSYGQRMPVVTVNMPDYHKIVEGEWADFSYHLVGYGYYYEEALVRLLGETIERYSLVTSSQFATDRFVKTSYNDLVKANEDVIPWELIDVFAASDYERFAAQNIQFVPLSPDDAISWLPCQSLYDSGRFVFIPVQCLYTAGVLVDDEPKFMTGFSKGTAAHGTRHQALRHAIMENIEADAFMLRWYAETGAPRLVHNDPILQEMTDTITGHLDCETLNLDLSMPDLPGYIFNTILLNGAGEKPAVLNGLGAGLEPTSTLFRTYVESLAIHYIGRNGSLIMPGDYLAPVDDHVHTNLDSNVAYWANATDAEFKQSRMRGQIVGEVALEDHPDLSGPVLDELDYILPMMKEIAPYGVVLDITPPEVADKGWSVMRTFFPELVQMSLPSFPYSNHPRMLAHGGVTNPLPHALP